MRKIFAVLGFQTQEISITFASDQFVRKLNKQYRGIDQPTDVLAFSMQEGEWTEIQPQILGDVVISVDTASRQAREMGHDLNRELTILLVHGILHLAGYDHMQKADAQKMKSMERSILEAIEDA
ncbi:MAG: rRNA maturation RNase YbeY [bacterium]